MKDGDCNVLKALYINFVVNYYSFVKFLLRFEVVNARC